MSQPRTFVIGDIHGCVDELEVLLDGIAPGSGDTLVFLGDYVDRGPSPRRVVDRLVRLQGEGPTCVFLRGNHEDMFLAYLGLDGMYPDAFLGNGGAVTLASYGLDFFDAEAARADMPPDHLRFFGELRWTFEYKGFLMVHAGISPERSLAEQRHEDLIWIRDDFTQQPHSLPYVVVFGHTPYRDIFWDRPYKLGLDTGLVYGNLLSCWEVDAGELHQVRRYTTQVVRRDLVIATGGPGAAAASAVSEPASERLRAKRH